MTPPRNYNSNKGFTPFNVFNPATFVNELEDRVQQNRSGRLVSYFLHLERFFSYVREFRTDDEDSEIPALSRLITEKGEKYGWKEQLISAFKGLVDFHYLKRTIKTKENRNLIDSDLATKSLDDEVYLGYVLQIARFLAWRYDLNMPQAIFDTCKMIEMDTISIDDIAAATSDLLAENNAERYPIIFVVDTSIPMKAYLDDVSSSLIEMFGLILDTPALKKGAEIAVITTTSRPEGKASLLFDFTDVSTAEKEIFGYKFEAYGPSHMEEAINLTTETIDSFCRRMRAERQSFAVPWIVLISGGKWVRTSSLNTGLDALIAFLHEHSSNVHDFDVHTVSPLPLEKLTADARANIESLPGEKYSSTNVKGIFRDIFKSIKILHSSAPQYDLPLKSAGTL